MSYPTEQEIRRRLRPFKAKLWFFAVFSLCVGGYLELVLGLSGAFEKSGNFLVAVSVVAYFWLDHRDYLTGHQAENFDSAGHIVPKKIMAMTEMCIATLGAFVAIFGTWVLVTITQWLCELSEHEIC